MLAVDGSTVMLPNNKETRAGLSIPMAKTGSRWVSRASVLYDVLNRIAVDATLAPVKAYEVDLAIAHLPHTTASDLLLMNRTPRPTA